MIQQVVDPPAMENGTFLTGDKLDEPPDVPEGGGT